MDREFLTIWGSMLVWLGAITLFLTMMRSLVARYTRLFHSRMRTTLESAEFIVRTGLAPPDWRQRRLVTDPGSSHWLARWFSSGAEEMDIQRLCVRRLERLIHFFEKAPVVQGSGTRSLLLEELRAQHKLWTQQGVSIAPAGSIPDEAPNAQPEENSAG